MKVGFTGTRKGMNLFQKKTLRKLLAEEFSKMEEFHHGDCVGADKQAAFIVWNKVLFEKSGCKVFGHPSTIRNMRAFAPCHSLCEEKPPLDRNRDIVDAVSVLIAAPETVEEERRSGTWSTIRYAKKCGLRIEYLWPEEKI